MKPHIEQIGSDTASLAKQIAIGGKKLSDHNKSEIHQNTQWYEAHQADFNELLDKLYKRHMPSQVTDDDIRKKRRSRAHGSGNTRRADAFNARNGRNGQPRTERHTPERKARTQ